MFKLKKENKKGTSILHYVLNACSILSMTKNHNSLTTKGYASDANMITRLGFSGHFPSAINCHGPGNIAHRNLV